MITKAEEAEFIIGIERVGGFVFDRFTSAAGIVGNFKIILPEALKRDKGLMSQMVGHMVAELAEVDVIAAVGGATDIAEQVALAVDKPLLGLTTITKRGRKSFGLPKGNKQILTKEPRIGFVEDVSSTWQTVEKATRQAGIDHLIVKALAGWRRGEPAPEGMSRRAIMAYNKRFPFRHLYEIPLSFPVIGIINRSIPLWLPTEKMKTARLPELAREVQ